ncbi:MAG: cyclic nucleotide-binding domain-containing protein [Leptolyngbyaceae bacterium]|nr:cyclic nucleotide-binding domain-containing protein [Leptolyngbyaceae bacterium]
MADVLLSELTNSDIDWLAEAGQQKRLPKGTTFSNVEGGDKNDFYLVLDGRLSVHALDASGARSQHALNAVMDPGEIIGVAALFDMPLPRLAFQAIEDTILLAVPIHMLRMKLNGDLAFAANFYRAVDLILSLRVEHLIEQPEKLRFQSDQSERDVLNAFSEFRDSDLNWLVQAGQVERYRTDDFLLKAGRPTDSLYIILDGVFSVALPENKINPLALCFECPIENASKMSVVTTITKGEIAGAMAFLDARPLPVTIRATRDSLVLSVSRSKFNLHIQQDLGFATRFYRILGPQLLALSLIAMELQGVGAKSTAQASDELEFEGELDLDALQRMSSGANRFNWMLHHLGVSVS